MDDDDTHQVGCRNLTACAYGVTFDIRLLFPYIFIYYGKPAESVCGSVESSFKIIWPGL